MYKYALDENDGEVGKKNEPFEAEQIKETIETKKNPTPMEEDEEDDGSYKSAQKRRLKSLASKFNTYDDEDSESMKQVIIFSYRRSLRQLQEPLLVFVVIVLVSKSSHIKLFLQHAI